MVQPKLALGTVQFGLPYGIARPSEALAPAEVSAILRHAWDNGIDLLDTAAGYGESEQVIGAARAPDCLFAIVTKTPPIGRDRVAAADVERIRAGIETSLERLRVRSLDVVLVHNALDLLVPGGADLFRTLVQSKKDGCVGRIGVSVYDPITLGRVLEDYPIEVVQLPLNVFDQRFARQGTVTDLASRGVEVHVRSVFLQGVLLTDADRLPPHLSQCREQLSRYHAEIDAEGLSRPAAALQYVLGCPGVARIVLGVDSLANLRENIAAFAVAKASRKLDYTKFAVDESRIIDPRTW